MQSQEGIPGPQEHTSPAQQEINTDPREQQQWRVPPQQEYQERPYAEGYAGLDTEDMWPREGEKLRPRSAGQRGIGGPLLFIILLCALIAAGTFFGIIIAWLSWLLITALVIAGIVIAAMSWRVVALPMPPQTFEVMEHPQLIIQNSAGSVSIRRGENGRVTVAPTKRVSGIGITPENMQVQYALQDNTLNVSTQVVWNLLQFGIRKIDLEITVPEGCDIQLNNGWGNIAVQGINGDMKLRTGSGRIEASNLQGQIALKTGSGSISATDMSGQMTLTTGSGSIVLEQVVAEGDSRIKTGSGSITFAGDLDPRGSYDLRTGSGSLYLTLPYHASFSLKASTGSGRVVNDFGRSEVGGASKAPLKVKTGSGSIYVRRSGG
jgi:Putative adhesin